MSDVIRDRKPRGVGLGGSIEVENQRPEAMISSWSIGKRRRFKVQDLKRSKGVYNWRKASAEVIQCMLKLATCTNVSAHVPLVGRSTISVQRELRSRLAESLAAGRHDKAFAKDCGHVEAPRVDELEKLVFTFPNKQDID